MGLIIQNYKKGGNEYVNAYAKVSKINFDNTTKIASFNIAVVPGKGSTNLIDTIERKWAKTTGKDVLVACYDAIGNNITSVKNIIAEKQLAIADIVDGDPIRIGIEKQIADLQADPILQLDGAVSDEVVEPIA